MWPLIHAAERRMEHLAAAFPDKTKLDADTLLIIEQAARELLLLESSDWPFLVTTGQAKDYAVQRFNSHLERFELLADALDNNRVGEAVGDARRYQSLDNPFPDIDYTAFSYREQAGKS
jgi:1,4-alpha-glucan branching enzyme